MAKTTKPAAGAKARGTKDKLPKKAAPKELSPKKLAPQKLSPKELSPKKLSPKKLSPKKLAGKKAAAPRPAPLPGQDAAVLDRLWDTIESRRNADPTVSHSARLMSRGTAKIAQKFGEEAVECLIEAVSGQSKPALVAESADVLYHLLVLWVDAGVRPEEVWAELTRREGVSGIAEKASRLKALRVSQSVETKKIP